MAEIKSVNELLNMKLDIPDYQRPYKWDIQNIDDLLSDITNAISDADRYRTDFKYRIGTIILHKTKDGIFDVVDGQQRIISLVLLKQCIEPDFECSILEKGFSNKATQYNIHRNSKFSNMSPEAKKSTFKDMIGKGSIKLRIMSELTEKNGNKVASLYWKETMYKKHEDEMLRYLIEACGIEMEDGIN